MRRVLIPSAVPPHSAPPSDSKPAVDSVARRRRRRPLLIVLLSLPLLAGMLGTPVATGDDLSDALARQKALQQRIADQKRQVQLLGMRQVGVRASIASTSRTLNGINANLADVKKQIDRLSAEIALTRASYKDLANQLTAIDGQLRALSNEEIRRQKALFQRKQLLGDRLQAAYETGNTSLLETILTARSFDDVLSEVGYYLDVGTQDQALAQQITQDVRDIAALHQAVMGVRADTEELRGLVGDEKKALDAELADVTAARTRLKGLQAKAAAALAAERAAYERLASNKKSLAAAIKRATAARAALAKKIDRIRQAQRNLGHIPSIYNGTLSWPMSGIISQEFGCSGVIEEPPRGGCAHFHEGIDIVAPYGTPIRASGPGTVLYIGWNYADGYDPAWIVIIAHSAGLETWYAHMQAAYPVRAGQSVSAGEVIGYEGSTGHSTGAHLHWAVRFNGAFVNPRLFV
jgi:murein DD-endopeptidase MepM/ murein hydrolase activator NlpD